MTAGRRLITTTSWQLTASALARSGIAALVLLAFAGASFASGYHPPFDTAFAEAEVVVMGEVTRFPPRAKENPYPAVDPERLPFWVYYMDVAAAYKGKARPKGRISIWDPNVGTASYHLWEGARNLTFLIKVDLAAIADEWVLFGMGDFDGHPTIKDTHLAKLPQPIYRPIRNITEHKESPDEFEGWMKLIDLRLNPPENIFAEYRKLARESDNRYVLHYILSHWTRPLRDEDVTLFRTVVKRHADDPYIMHPALDALRKQGQTFEGGDVESMLRQTPPHGRESGIISQIGKDNIEQCRDILLEWITDDKDMSGAIESIKVLARLDPGYLKRKLEETDMPFWQLIPALRALGISGSDVGKKDYSAEILAVSTYTLDGMGELVRGDDLQAFMVMSYGSEAEPSATDERDEWCTALPLLVPHFASVDRSTRRTLRALMNTLGYTPVEEKGEIVLQPSKPPVHITLEMKTLDPKTSGPITVELRERGTMKGPLVCFTGEVEWSLEHLSGAIQYWGDDFDTLEKPDPPADEFVRIHPGVVRTTVVDFATDIEGTGAYKLSAVKLYPHDGSDHGITAWSGCVGSNVVEFTVTQDRATLQSSIDLTPRN